MDLLFNIPHWVWFCVALGLTFLEMLFPAGLFWLWVAVGAAFMGVFTYFMPEVDWQNQLLIFSGVFVASFFAWRYMARFLPNHANELGLNNRAERHVGRVVTLKEPIVDNHGKVWLDNVCWQVQGPDAEAGQKVKVTETDGLTLKVELTTE